MAYVIDTRSGQQILIEDNSLNEEFSIKLVGRNYSNYGEPIAENFVDLLTSFGNDSPPARAVQGQVWWDTGTQQLRVYDESAQWRSASSVRLFSNGEPTGNTSAPNNPGSMYFAPDLGKLFVHNNTEFVPAVVPGEVIDPNNYLSNSLASVPSGVTSMFGTRLQNIFINDSTDIYRAVLAVNYQGNSENTVAVFNGDSDFEVNTSSLHFSEGKTLQSDGDYITQLTDSDNLGTTIYRGLNVHDAAISALRVNDSVTPLNNSAVIGSMSNPFEHGYFETVTGNVTGNLVGNMLSGGANTVILDNGTDGTDAQFTGNVVGQVSDISNHSTTDLSEGDNLYYTTERVRTNVSVDAQSNLLYNNVTGVFNHQLTTDDVAEGDNLYYTIARVRANVSATNTGTGFGDLSYDEPNGVFSYDRVTTAEIRDQLSAGTGISYNTATGSIAADEANIDHDSLGGFVAGEHVNHNTVSIIAGNGLTGGGNISASRTLNIGEGYGIDVDNDSISVDNTQIRQLFSINSSDQTVLSFDTGTGVISFLGDTDVATSNLGTWVRTANVSQDVFGVKSWKDEVRFENPGSGNNIVLSNDPTVAYGDPGLTFNGSSGSVEFGSTGSIVASDDITAFSDRKLKTNLEQIENALDKVTELTGYIYERIDQPGHKHTGLIAQDVEKVLPEAVSDNDGTLSVAYGNLMGLMVEAIKELKQEVQSLKQQRGE